MKSDVPDFDNNLIYRASFDGDRILIFEATPRSVAKSGPASILIANEKPAVASLVWAVDFPEGGTAYQWLACRCPESTQAAESCVHRRFLSDNEYAEALLPRQPCVLYEGDEGYSPTHHLWGGLAPYSGTMSFSWRPLTEQVFDSIEALNGATVYQVSLVNGSGLDLGFHAAATTWRQLLRELYCKVQEEADVMDELVCTGLYHAFKAGDVPFNPGRSGGAGAVMMKEDRTRSSWEQEYLSVLIGGQCHDCRIGTFIPDL